MKLTKIQLSGYRQILADKGIVLSLEESEAQANNLVTLFTLLADNSDINYENYTENEETISETRI